MTLQTVLRAANALELHDVEKKFKKKRNEYSYALKGVSLTDKRGEVVGILGPNGSGKSTLVRVMSTLTLPDAGEVRVFDIDAVKQPREVQRYINRVSVEASFFKKMSSQENLIFGAISLFFDMTLSNANYGVALVILAICSVSLVGFGMVAAVMPLLSPEKGQQVTYIFSAVLLLISGIYYSVDVLPEWMQPLAYISPIYYALEGIRAALLDGASLGSQWDNIWPLLIMGLIFPPLGLWLFQQGEHFAKKTGRLKRSG